MQTKFKEQQAQVKTCAQNNKKARNSGFIDRQGLSNTCLRCIPFVGATQTNTFHLEQQHTPISKHFQAKQMLFSHKFLKNKATKNTCSALEHCRHSTYASNKGIYFFARVVQAKRRANGTRNAQTSHKRLGAVVTRANGNAQTIEQGAEV